MKKYILLIILSASFLPCPAFAKYSGGTGEPNTPYLISTPEDMNAVGANPADWGSRFLLTNDINMASYTYTTALITPDTSSSSGFQGTKFTGVFDGAGFKVTNLTIDTADADNDYLGLFGYADSTGTLENLGVEDVNITGGDYSASLGGLAGYNDGSISDCYSTGQVAGGDLSYYLGGLVGDNSGTISDCYSTGLVAGGDFSDPIAFSRFFGGLVGCSRGTIINCYATGQVIGGANSYYLGGLVGDNSGTISDCFSIGQVTGEGVLGGLVGDNSGPISGCFSTGQVTSGYFYFSEYLGGLVGYNDGSISDCYSTGQVTGGDYSDYLGGLVGFNRYSTISNCFSTGQVTGDNYLGGLVGFNLYGAISNCFWDVNTSGLDTSPSGIGLTTEQMQDMFYYSINGWAGNTNWTMIQGQYPRLAWENAGGEYIAEPVIELTGLGTQQDPYLIQTVDDLQLIGLGSILWDKHYVLTTDLDLAAVSLNRIGYDLSNSFKGLFNGSGHVICNLSLNLPNVDNIGLFGYIGSGGKVKHLGIENVNILGNNHVGGLAGVNSGTISDCFSTGQVTGEDRSYYLGGLVGWNRSGTISDCFSTEQVTGGYYSYSIGGLAGYNEFGTISDCFSTGQVTSGDLSYYLGGLAGYNNGTISDCFSTGQVTGGDFSHDLGGLVGRNSSTIDDCFWDVNTSGLDTSSGGIGKTTEEMQTISTFTDAGWDFLGENENGIADIWRLCSEGLDYPKLSWQFLLGDFICPDGVDYLDLSIFTDNWLLPVLAGDLEKDGFIDLYDFAILANAWQSFPGHPNWNPACDIAPDDGDGFVGIDDLAVLITGWIQVCATAGDIAPVPADNLFNFLDFAVFAENWLMGIE
jgi:hypothetical protein